MKRLILTLAAMLTLGGGLAATSASAQPRDREVVRTTRTVVVHRRQNWHRDDRNDNRRWHRNYNRGRHYGWRNRRGHGRSCTTTWRHHTRIRTCRRW